MGENGLLPGSQDLLEFLAKTGPFGGRMFEQSLALRHWNLPLKE